MRFHSSCRSPSDRWLCSTATVSPKRPRNRSIACGVSEISGTRAMAPWPASSADWIAARYTSVLPLPVTPCSSTTPGFAAAISSRTAASADACSAISGGATVGSTVMRSCGLRRITPFASTSQPFFSRLRSPAGDTPVSASSAAAVHSPRCFSNAHAAACFGLLFASTASSTFVGRAPSARRATRCSLCFAPSRRTAAGRIAAMACSNGAA